MKNNDSNWNCDLGFFSHMTRQLYMKVILVKLTHASVVPLLCVLSDTCYLNLWSI